MLHIPGPVVGNPRSAQHWVEVTSDAVAETGLEANDFLVGVPLFAFVYASERTLPVARDESTLTEFATSCVAAALLPAARVERRPWNSHPAWRGAAIAAVLLGAALIGSSARELFHHGEGVAAPSHERPS